MTWRAYSWRSGEKENSRETSDYITSLHISESGGTVPLKRVMNVEG